MNAWEKKLLRKQLDQKLENFKPALKNRVPEGGWVKAIREALGMTMSELASRTNVHQSRISRIESSEMSKEIKLSTLQKMADGLGVKFIYGFVTENDLEAIIRKQARKVAEDRLCRVDHSMKLEAQGVSKQQLKEMMDDLVDQILFENPKNLWS